MARHIRQSGAMRRRRRMVPTSTEFQPESQASLQSRAAELLTGIGANQRLEVSLFAVLLHFRPTSPIGRLGGSVITPLGVLKRSWTTRTCSDRRIAFSDWLATVVFEFAVHDRDHLSLLEFVAGAKGRQAGEMSLLSPNILQLRTWLLSGHFQRFINNSEIDVECRPFIQLTDEINRATVTFHY